MASTSIDEFCQVARDQDLDGTLASVVSLADFDVAADALDGLDDIAYPEELLPTAKRVIKNAEDYLDSLSRSDFSDYGRAEQQRDLDLSSEMSDDVASLRDFVEDRC